MRVPQQVLERLDGRDVERAVTPPAVDAPPSAGTTLPLAGAVDDADSLVDVLDLLAVEPFVTGRHPYGRSTQLDNVRVDAALLPDGATVVREAVEDHAHSRLAVGDGYAMRVTRWKHSNRAALTVTAVDPRLAETVLEQATAGAVQDPPPASDTVPIGFWHLGAHGPRRTERDIDAAPWDVIRRNYSTRVAAALQSLMGVTADSVTGRMLLLHGPPGTGKTTALRALARQWRSWCQVDCVLDPERLFGSPAYLMDVALGEDNEQDGSRWRLLLLEDCDELIRGEAKASAGQALSRLLNLTDGLLGQGRNVLVAVSTNEDLAALHPAVVRPGRCLARVEVGALPYGEAAAWLGTRTGVPAAGATLAELYALRSGEPVIASVEPSPAGGLYL